MKAVILAAGTASRLRPLTEHTPKCLLKIGGKCLLERTVSGLAENGIRDLVIVTGYLEEQIVGFIRRHYPDLKVEFIHNDRYATTNNIYSLWLAGPSIGQEGILLLDSDIVFDPALIAAILTSSCQDCLAVSRHPLGKEEMKVIPDAQGRVGEISKTCSIPDALGESIGIEKMSAHYLRHLYAELDRLILEEKQDNVFYEVAFERLISRGQTFGIVDTTSFFSVELDTAEDFRAAEEQLPPHLL